MALAQQDEERAKAEQREMLEQYRQGEISATGVPVKAPVAEQPKEAGKSGKEKKNREKLPPITEEEFNQSFREMWEKTTGTPVPEGASWMKLPWRE